MEGVPGGIHENVDLLGADALGRGAIGKFGERKVAVSQFTKLPGFGAEPVGGGKKGEVETAAVELLEQGQQKLRDRMGAQFGGNDAQTQGPLCARGEGAGSGWGAFAGGGALILGEHGLLPALGLNFLFPGGVVTSEGVETEQVAIGGR